MLACTRDSRTVGRLRKYRFISPLWRRQPSLRSGRRRARPGPAAYRSGRRSPVDYPPDTLPCDSIDRSRPLRRPIPAVRYRGSGHLGGLSQVPTGLYDVQLGYTAALIKAMQPSVPRSCNNPRRVCRDDFHESFRSLACSSPNLFGKARRVFMGPAKRRLCQQHLCGLFHPVRI